MFEIIINEESKYKLLDIYRIFDSEAVDKEDYLEEEVFNLNDSIFTYHILILEIIEYEKLARISFECSFCKRELSFSWDYSSFYDELPDILNFLRSKDDSLTSLYLYENDIYLVLKTINTSIEMSFIDFSGIASSSEIDKIITSGDIQSLEKQTIGVHRMNIEDFESALQALIIDYYKLLQRFFPAFTEHKEFIKQWVLQYGFLS
jgi:hypothetical protein